MPLLWHNIPLDEYENQGSRCCRFWRKSIMESFRRNGTTGSSGSSRSTTGYCSKRRWGERKRTGTSNPSPLARLNRGRRDDTIGTGLLDHDHLKQLSRFVDDLHTVGKEAWLAGSISRPKLPAIWNTDVDVVCVGCAACVAGWGSRCLGGWNQRPVAEFVATVTIQE